MLRRGIEAFALFYGEAGIWVMVLAARYSRGGIVETVPLGVLTVGATVFVYTRERRFFRRVVELMEE